MSDSKPLNKDERRERGEPNTTGQDGSGDAGRDPTKGKQHDLGAGDKLSARNAGNEIESDDAANKSEFVPSGK